FFSSRRRHTRSKRDWSSDVCSSDLGSQWLDTSVLQRGRCRLELLPGGGHLDVVLGEDFLVVPEALDVVLERQRDHVAIDRAHREIGRASCRERNREGEGDKSIRKEE